MSRRSKILLWSAGSLIAILALGVLLVLTFNWNHAKPWINKRVSETTGRAFEIHGDLSLNWQRAEATETGWRRWVPWPDLVAQDVTMGNPDWLGTGPNGANMASAKRVEFPVNPLLLINYKIAISRLTLDQPTLLLQRDAGGRNNWTLKDNGPTKWRLDLKQLAINQGSIHLVDAIRHADLTAGIDTLNVDAGNRYALGLKVSGSLNGDAVSGNGKAGGVLALQQESTQFPVQANLRVGKTVIDIDGMLTDPRKLAALDVNLNISGVSMAKLYSLTGIVLPETPHFVTKGRLKGVINSQGGNWTYEKFTGTVGSSDIEGTLEYESKKPRPLLKGAVVSNLLKLEDLGPLIGADSNASKMNRGAAPVQPTDKVMPAETFKTDRWTSIDAQVKIVGRKIVRAKALPIDNLSTDLQLQDGVLSLTPLNFGIAGGNLASTIKLDGRNKVIKAQIQLAARHLGLKKLFPTFQVMQASFGEINGDASLSATGNSIAAMVGSSNGELKAQIRHGSISKMLLEEAGLNIGNVIITKITGDKQVKLNCMAADFSVTSGLMQTRTFIVDTDDSILHVGGQINLAQEQLDLNIKPDSKGVRVLSLRAPLYVTGSFKAPKVHVDVGVLALKAGTAIALGVAAPITAILPLVKVDPKQDSPCDNLLKKTAVKPVAPPPGKKYHAAIAQ